jgi:hypothetical protein
MDAPGSGVQDSADTAPDSGVQDSAEEVARQNKEKLLPQITDAKMLRDAEPYTPIMLPKQIRSRVIHYYDPATWKPKGNWGNGRYIRWTKKTTRPFEMWPEGLRL